MEIDQALDAEGILIREKPVICGNCMLQMERISPKSLRCLKCGRTYRD